MGRTISIDGKYISNAIGYCHCKKHPGTLNHVLAYQHKCVAKKCRYLEKYSDKAFEKSRYYNEKRRK